MSVPTAISALLPQLPSAPGIKPGAQTTQAQVNSLAQEFESLMLLQVMRQLRQTLTSFGDEGSDKVGGDLSPMTETIDTELSRFLSKAGGFGLGGFLSKAINRQQESMPASRPADRATGNPAAPAQNSSTVPGTVDGVGATSSVPPAPASAADDDGAGDSGGAAAATPSANRALDVVGSVTSRYGWRSDPIVHAARFHGGVDIRAAYGQEIPAAGDGQVVFSGEQNGYGMTVVVQHPDGLQTRYAHLSSIGVQNGEQVVSGQSIGRAGQSGRATGPHLHFELMRDGQKLDPTSLVRTAAEFKRNQVAADYMSGKPSGRHTVFVGETGANDDAVGSTQ